MQPSLNTIAPELPARDAEPVPPITETPPKEPAAKDNKILLPKALVDDVYREARKNFALIPDMTFALAAGARAVRDTWEHKDGKFLRKDKPFANYIPPTNNENDAPLSEANDKPAEPVATEPQGFSESAPAPQFEHAANASMSAAPDRDGISNDPMQQVAYVTEQGTLTGASISKPSAQNWTPIQRANAAAIEPRIVPVGAAIQKYGTPEQRAAWRLIWKFSLQPTRIRTGGAADYADGVFSVDLNKVGAKPDPNDTRRVLLPDPNYVNFMIVHEVFHATASNQDAMREAHKMQRDRWQEGEPTVGSPQWSVEVRHDKMVYDFLLKAGLLPVPPPPIERIAPYYAEHLANPRVPVHTFKVPGYDKPL